MGLLIILGFAGGVVLFAILLSLKSSASQIGLGLSLRPRSDQESITNDHLSEPQQERVR